jgi:hypothetical protein
MTTFDNRGSTLNNKMLNGANIHLIFEFEGKRYLYTYIRKHACSAFKNFITNVSCFREKSKGYDNNLKFLATHHRATNIEQLGEIDCSFFVYRSPLERLSSCYVNKFIQRKGASDIFNNFTKTTDIDCDEATFRQFVFEYLPLGDSKIDPHCWSYKKQLLPIKYTHALDMNKLQEHMSDLIGTETALKYFGVKSNLTNYTGIGKHAADIPSLELHELWKKYHKSPTNSELYSLEISQFAEEVLHQDILLVTNCAD